MNNQLDSVLLNIAETYASEISRDSRYYLEVDIGKRGAKLGAADVDKQYRAVNAIVPLKNPAKGMRVRIDGRTFVNYAQFENGVVVPGYVAKNSSHLHKAFIAQDSMILGFD